MVRIGIDCRFSGSLAGLGSFTRGLVKALAQEQSPHTFVLFVRSTDEPWLQTLPNSPTIQILRADIPHYSFAEQTRFPRILRRADLDVLMAPYFNVPFFSPVPFVCVIHDLILHAYPNQASLLKRFVYKILLKRSLQRAQSIIAISTATKDEIVRQYPFAEEKTSVIYYGVDPVFTPRSKAEQDAVKKKHGLVSPYFLYVGNCKEHKNVKTLLRAFELANVSGHELALVAGGKECETLALTRGVRRLSSVPQEDLAALYSGAAALVTATLAEGFCLPVIEAMACECPVLATKIGPIPEIAMDHALLVKPTVEALTKGLERIVHEEAFRSPERLRFAREWTKRYSWETAAKEYRRTLELAVN